MSHELPPIHVATPTERKYEEQNGAYISVQSGTILREALLRIIQLRAQT